MSSLIFIRISVEKQKKNHYTCIFYFIFYLIENSPLVSQTNLQSIILNESTLFLNSPLSKPANVSDVMLFKSSCRPDTTGSAYGRVKSAIKSAVKEVIFIEN